MAITAETRQNIMELAVAANNAAPGTTLLSELVAMSTSGSSLLDIANHLADSASFKATYPTFQTAAEFGTEFLGNLIPEASAAAIAEGVTIIEGMLAAGSSRGAIILEAATFLAALDESDASFGSSAALFNNRVEVATYHTITSEAADPWSIPESVTSSDDSVDTAKAAVDTALTPAAPVVGSATYDLTTSVDDITGGSADDTFNATQTSGGQQTLNTLDQLDGGDGADKLNVSLKSDVTPSSITSIETINVDATAAATLSLANATGVENVNISGVTGGTFQIKGLSKSVAVAIADTDQAHTVTFNDVTGSADSATVTVANKTGSTALTVPGVEVLTVNSTGSANDVDLSATSSAYVNVTGSADFKTSSLATNSMIYVRSFDASAATGKLTLVTGNQSGLGSTDLTVSGGAGNDSIDASGHTQSDLSISGGAGNDTITVALGNGDTLDGGDGTDTLVTTSVASLPTSVANFETLSLNATGGALNQDFDNLTGSIFTKVVDKAGGNNVTFTDAPSTIDTVALNSTAAGATLVLDRKTDGADDSVTVTVGSQGYTNVDLRHEESITFSSSKAAVTLTTVTANDATSITVTGDEDFTIGSLASNAGLATIDASGSTGLVSIGLSANASDVPMTATAGSGGLKFTGAEEADTLIGGAGADSFIGGDGGDSITGAAGNDTLDGGAGNDVIEGGDGADSITAGGGVDNISGGAGNDTIVLSTNYATSDTVDGGDGTDTVTMDVGANITPTFANVETITANATDAVGTNTLTVSSSESVNRVNVTATNANDVIKVASLASGSTVSVADTNVVPTIDTVADAALTIRASAASAKAVTVTDAETVTALGYAVNGAFGSLALDAADTTALTVYSVAGSLDVDVNNVTGSDAVQTVSLYTVGSGGDAAIGTMVDISSLTSLTATGSIGDITTGTFGGTDQADGLTTITATASGGSDISIGAIEADNSSNDVTDNAITITATANGELAADESSITFGMIDNTYGTATATLAGERDIDFTTGTGGIKGTNITITREGEGDTEIDLIDGSGNVSFTATGSGAIVLTDIDATSGTVNVDASAATGALTADTDSTGSVTILGGSAADTITADGTTATGKTHHLDGGAGNDTITGGAGAETIIGGAGIDSIDSGAGVDNISGGDGNDIFIFDTNGDLTATDTVDGGDGTDSLTLTIAGNLSPALTSVERVDLTSTGNRTLTMTNASSVTRLDVENGSSNTLTVADLASGATVRTFDADTSLSIDTGTDGSVTIDNHLDTTSGSTTISDAKDVTIQTTTLTASAGDLTALALDTYETETLTLVGGYVSTADVDTGAITSSDALTTLTVSGGVDGSDIDIATIVDADSLTSITATVDYADFAVGNIGSSGSAEALSSINLTATRGGLITLSGTITADTTDSTVDNDMTVTTSAGSGSTIDLGTILNTYGTMTVSNDAVGTLDSTRLDAVDLTFDITAGGGTHADVNGSDDVTITAANSASLAFTALGTGSGAGGLLTVTASGTAAFSIATLDASSGSYTVDGSAATGTVSIGGSANNRTGSGTLTGGSGADTLVGGSGAEQITGNAGIDSITGGGGNDTLIGGAGGDTIVLGGAGSASIDGGDGNDTITMATNYSSGDTIDGGDGTDTASLTLSATVAASVTNVERVAVTFAAGGALNASSMTGLDYISVIGDGSNTAGTVVNLADSSRVIILAGDEVETLTLDSAAGGALRVTAKETMSNALTITDSGTVTIDASATAATAGFGSMVLDTVDTTALIVNGANTGYGLSTGNVTGTNKLTSLTASTSTASGTVTIGQVADLGSLTSVDLTAAVANLTLSTGADFGTASNGDEGEYLATINLTATGGATLDFADGQTIHADTITNSTTDLTQTITVVSDSSSTINVGTVDNEFGNIVVSAAASEGALTFDALTATDVTATLGGAGNVNLGTVTASDDIVITASNLSGTLTAVLANTDRATVTTGQGAISSLTTANGTSTSTYVNFGSANSVTDLIVTNGTAIGYIEITNFETGTSGDAIDLSNAGIEGGDYVSGTDELVNVDGTALTTNAISITTVTDNTTDLDTLTTNLIMLDGDFATTELVQTAIQTSGTYQLTLGAGIVEATDLMLIAWDDGTDSYIGVLEITDVSDETGSAGTSDDGSTIDDATVNTLVKIVGVSDVTDLVAANFGTNLIT